ncbi:MAG: hypothetical protein EZS28_051848 [Streblomastix strix]|uniref:Uncharacterized protein n=1 Tax=Streblomastix strix TaxID=222440 RepID=A0A5J4SZE1_9EUKA|nr:MAG: hypothetical protein EZS28_051848 [Streblomastix strix]
MKTLLRQYYREQREQKQIMKVQQVQDKHLLIRLEWEPSIPLRNPEYNQLPIKSNRGQKHQQKKIKARRQRKKMNKAMIQWLSNRLEQKLKE